MPDTDTQAFGQKSRLICFFFIVPLSAFATCCCIPNSFDMQHDHVLKTMNFDSKGQRGVSAGIIFANTLLHP